MNMPLLNRIWWENKFKYRPLIQRIFLLGQLSANFPATMNIEPTNICNLRCRFCPTRNTNRPLGMMSWRLYQKIIDQILQQKKLAVLWLNKDGEPLLHPKISQMTAYAKKRRVAKRVEVYTNGVLLTEPTAKKLIASQLDSLVISIDAIDRMGYKRIKQQDCYQLIVKNVWNFMKLKKILKANKPIVSVKLIDLGDEKVIKQFQDFWQGKADNVMIQKLHGWEGSINIKNHPPAGGSKIKNNNYRYPCNLPWLSMAVHWNGEVSPCCVNYLKNELVMGDLNKQSIKEIWQSERWQRLRRAHLTQDFADFPTCQRCTFWQQLPRMKRYLKVITND